MFQNHRILLNMERVLKHETYKTSFMSFTKRTTLNMAVASEGGVTEYEKCLETVQFMQGTKRPFKCLDCLIFGRYYMIFFIMNLRAISFIRVIGVIRVIRVTGVIRVTKDYQICIVTLAKLQLKSPKPNYKTNDTHDNNKGCFQRWRPLGGALARSEAPSPSVRRVTRARVPQ